MIALTLSLKTEKHLEILVTSAAANLAKRHSDSSNAPDGSPNSSVGHSAPIPYGIQYQNRDGDESVVWGQGGTITSATAGTSQSLGQTRSPPSTPKFSTSFPSNPPSIRRHFPPSLQQEQDLSHLGDKDLEEKALSLAIQEMREESGQKWRPWAANGRATGIGEIVLIVDSNTVVLEDC